jgi:hypothetical protein
MKYEHIAKGYSSGSVPQRAHSSQRRPRSVHFAIATSEALVQHWKSRQSLGQGFTKLVQFYPTALDHCHGTAFTCRRRANRAQRSVQKYFASAAGVDRTTLQKLNCFLEDHIRTGRQRLSARRFEQTLSVQSRNTKNQTGVRTAFSISAEMNRLGDGYERKI